MTSPRGDDCRLVIGYGNEKPTNWLYASIRWFFYWRVDPSESLHRISPSVHFAPNPRRFSSLAFPLGRPAGSKHQKPKLKSLDNRDPLVGYAGVEIFASKVNCDGQVESVDLLQAISAWYSQ